MTHIANQRTLNTHLLSYLKQRWTTPLLQVTANPGNDFLAWLGPNGHTIDGPTTLTLNGYGAITLATMGASLSAFAATNLPADGESTASFLTRFQLAELNNMGGGSILDDAAHQAMLNQLTPVPSGGVVAAWNLWYPTDLANPGRTFQQRLTAFKQHLRAAAQILTGQAVIALAAHNGFDYNGWLNGQMAGILGGPAGNAIILPKVHEEASCWSWALHGCAPMTVTPDDIFTWLHAPLATPEPAPLANVVHQNHVNARQQIHNARATIHTNGLATLGNGFDQNWATNGAKVNLVQQINRSVYMAMVELYGFVVQHNPTGLAVAIEYRNNDGVSWEHWWVENNGLVIETFPSMRFTIQVTNQTQVQGMSPMQQAQYTVVRIAVSALQAVHNDTIRAGMAQYL